MMPERLSRYCAGRLFDARGPRSSAFWEIALYFAVWLKHNHTAKG